jgi:pyruvate dehydrogenase E1 component beta subunit
VAKLTMVQAINLALQQEMASDSDVVVLGEDVGLDGGVFRVTEGLYERFGADRVIDTPLAEAGIIGTSIGMALYGLKPVCEIQFLGFIYQAFHQLRSHASRYRSRTRGRYTCPLVVRAPYGGGIRAIEEHSESSESLFIHTPGLKVVVPSTPRLARSLLISAIRDPDPVIFLEPTRAYRSPREEVPEDEETFPLGLAHVVQEGDDLTLVTWGAMRHHARGRAGAGGTRLSDRSDRPAHACPGRYANDHDLGPEDGSCRGGARGAAYIRVWCGDRRPHQRGGTPVSGSADPPCHGL